MTRWSDLPESLTRGPFLFRDAVDAGVARSRLRAPDLRHPHRGLYVAGGEPRHVVARCEEIVSLLGQELWFSHLTAGRLWNFRLPYAWSADEDLHVMAVSDAAPMRRPGIIGWETEVADLPRLMLGMLPVIAPADVWAQLAVPGATGVDPDTGSRRRLTSDWLVAVGDYLLTGPRIGRARVPLCTRDDLMRAIQRRRRKRGVKDLALALDRVRPGAHSPRETLLRLGLVDHGLPEPDVQVPVVTAAGLRHADLGYPDARLLLEYQGDHHRTDRRQWLEDLTRVQLLQDAGYDVMVVGAADIVPDSAALAGRVRRALARARTRGA